MNKGNKKLQEGLLGLQNSDIQSIVARIYTIEAKFEALMSLQTNHTTTFPTPQEIRHGISYGSFKLNVPHFDG